MNRSLLGIIVALLLVGCSPEVIAPVVDIAPLAEAVVFLGGALVLSTIIATFGRAFLARFRGDEKGGQDADPH